jgi:hypothetical protein
MNISRAAVVAAFGFSLAAQSVEAQEACSCGTVLSAEDQAMMRVSVSSNGEQGDDSSPAHFEDRVGISDDGRYVVFSTSATNFLKPDANASFRTSLCTIARPARPC